VRRCLLRAVSAALVLAALAGCTSPSPSSEAPEPVASSAATVAPTRNGVPPTSNVPPGATGSEPATGYLALGDSLTAGFQAGRGEDKAGGYVGPVLEAWRRRHPDAQLTNLACFGDDTTAMLTGNGSTCSYPQGSQLAAALAALRQGTGIGLVTITMGVNDIYGCTVVGIDGTCIAYATRTVGTALRSMLAQIRAAAPAALIIALTYYNPLLATSSGTPEAPSTLPPQAASQQVATDSALAFAGLNRVITTAVTAVGGRVADVAGAFAVTDTSGSPLPVNIQRLCDWTSFCTVGDAHPTDAGYAAMARAVTAVL
jgi:lysophospholipase L1-like esterase